MIDFCYFCINSMSSWYRKTFLHWWNFNPESGRQFSSCYGKILTLSFFSSILNSTTHVRLAHNFLVWFSCVLLRYFYMVEIYHFFMKEKNHTYMNTWTILHMQLIFLSQQIIQFHEIINVIPEIIALNIVQLILCHSL